MEHALTIIILLAKRVRPFQNYKHVHFFLFLPRLYRIAAMVDAVYRGNIEELLSVINHLKKYIIVFVIVLLVLISIFHFSKYSVHIVPLITVTLVLLPAVYYTTVLVIKFGTGVIASNQTVSVLMCTHP